VLLLCATPAIIRAQNVPAGPSPPDYKGQKFEIVGESGANPSASSVTSPTGFTTLTTVPMYPVLYCGDAGGGTNEYRIIPGAGPVRWLLEVPTPPTGAKMFDARYEAYDNIAALGLFAEILVEKVDDSHISMTVLAYPNCDHARVRLRITVSYAK
jgi:hypothetical protein